MTQTAPTVVVLDRDGVINADSEHYVKSADEWHALPGALTAIARLKAAGFIVAVATNQSGLARGLFDLTDLANIHQRMLDAVEDAGGSIDGIFFCPHGPDDGCECRKPAPGLLLQIAERFACGLQRMVFIGDSERDVAAARAVGVRPLLVLTGNGAAAAGRLKDQAGLEVFPDLEAATQQLVSERGKL